jgi:hypothetical protein
LKCNILHYTHFSFFEPVWVCLAQVPEGAVKGPQFFLLQNV